MNEVAIFVDSFDGYSDIWPIFVKIFEKYWPNCTIPIYLVSNEKEFNYKNLINIKTGKEKNWFDRTIKALKEINEEYIIFFLEDYFISKRINEKVIFDIIKYMKDNDIFYYQLSPKDECRNEKKCVIQVLTTHEFSISLQLVIWNKENLLSMLQDIYCNNNVTTAWDFENYFVLKYKNVECNEIFGAKYDTRDILGYKNGVLQGKWLRSTLNFYKKRGIIINTGDRKITSIRETLYYNLKKFFSTKFNYRTKNIFKKLMRKIGFEFMTD